MTKTVRIPKAELSGVQGRLLKIAIRKKIGRVPDNVAVMWNHPAVFKDLMRAGARTATWDRVDVNLASFAVMAAAAEIGYGACLYASVADPRPEWGSAFPRLSLQVGGGIAPRNRVRREHTGDRRAGSMKPILGLP